MTFLRDTELAWCPGCGNFAIRLALAETLEELNLEPNNTLMITGIGQAAKMPHYLNINFFNGLHGRGLPVAFAAKTVNPDLTVIAESGDGDMYGEGGNHLVHTIRRNFDVTILVHNNQIYGLTKGQGSPTTEIGHKTSSQVKGVINEPLNPLALAISLNAPFVARTWSGAKDHFKRVVSEAIKFKGLALVDVMHPCVSFNKVNTFAWYKERLYDVSEDDSSYDVTDKVKAFEKSLEFGDRIPMGIIYKKERKTYHELHHVLKKGAKLVDLTDTPDVTDELEKMG
ncbi:MAG: 2-oxoacid ferredoxin oxidoreductase [Kosmotoga sp.]|nr:MAG: 2-oxoacid ferredoxin oxidoreductase [Kosmotoga sp.]